MTAAVRLADQVAVLLRRERWAALDEGHLRDRIAAVLTEAGIGYARDVDLPGNAGWVDFLTAGGAAIVVAVDGRVVDVAQDLARFAGAPQVAALLLATTRPGHMTLPVVVRGTSLTTVLLRRPRS